MRETFELSWESRGAQPGNAKATGGVVPTVCLTPAQRGNDRGCTSVARLQGARRNDRLLLPQQLALVLIVLAAGFAVLAIGGAPLWARATIHVLLAAAAICWLAGRRGSIQLAWLPLTVLAVGCLQLAPLRHTSPATLASPADGAANGSLETAGVPGGGRPISLDPSSTVQAVGHLLLLALTLVIVADVARDSRTRRRLAIAFSSAGLGVWLLGLLAMPSAPRTVLGWYDLKGPVRPWISPVLPPAQTAGVGMPARLQVGHIGYEMDEWIVGDTFGPFIYSNHFAACLGLTLPLGLGMLLGAAARGQDCVSRCTARRDGRDLQAPITCRGKRFWCAAGLIAGAAAAVGTVGLAAGSRAGAASLLAGLLVTVARGASRQGVRRFAGVCLVLFLLGAAGLLILSFQMQSPGPLAPSDSASRGIAELMGSLGRDAQKRWVPVSAALVMYQSSPWLGVGWGNYAHAYPAVSNSPVRYAYAHNEYLQLLAEAGVVGAALVAALLLLIVRQLRREWNRGATTDRGLVAGLAGSLVAIALHCLFDWNLHCPANALLLTVLLGVVFSFRGGQPHAGGTPAGVGRPAAAVLVVAAAAASVLSLQSAVREPARMALRRAVALQGAREYSAEQKRMLLEQALPAALQAAVGVAEDSGHAETLGQAYLHLSGGLPSKDLAQAAEWYRRALALCPVNRRAAETLQQIEAVGRWE